jgi:ribonuclease HI
MKIEVYTDGSATIASKPGGYGFVIVGDGQKIAEGSGHMELATNNDAELEAAIQGLVAVLKLITESPTSFSRAEASVTLVSDSQLILGWVNGTYRFKQADKRQKYDQLKYLVRKLNVGTRWVLGHSGDEHNERCDRLANDARLLLNRELDKEEAKSNGKTFIGTRKTGTMCIWYKDVLKIVDFEANVIENYDRSIHGPRGGILEIREEKSR